MVEDVESLFSIRFSYNCGNLREIPGTVVGIVEIHGDLAQMTVREEDAGTQRSCIWPGVWSALRRLRLCDSLELFSRQVNQNIDLLCP